MHPEPGDLPGQIRWIIPPGILTVRGTVRAPGELGRMQADGTLTAITVGARSVVLTAEPAAWPRIGKTVRTALTAALRTPADWHAGTPAGDGSGGHGNDTIAEVAREVIDGRLGDYARSHGGRIALIGVDDGVVTVDLAGACRGCPASADTLRSGFEAELRRRCRDVVEVRALQH
ncbi:NifU family protein [Gordonia amarae]|uniref:NifU family protein n=2 Tax=Gordonia amarae TaxID=36821 RepID=A0A857KQJ8_9ACTN|nr:NifU family protein [Gordonia amarae]MCS3880073.1 Fe-S cluster biogenesis protein NfuA [Gordonia amarae]QHN18447.1 NifU family protein [Gordonia amarae]QHN22929.1 NifU family protein [Gordonia amarae]QHN31831.1 NifU family protein [Gordonia amarae]QHN40578.1 NifU family protein [Gordonia amarae]